MNPHRLLSTWRRLAALPGGRRVFAFLIGRFVPYSGSIGAVVVSLEPGNATIALHDRRAVRNHLGSVHAVALANLAELTSGLAMLTALGPSVRGIVTSLRIDYHKKARGTLTASSHVTPPSVTEPTDAEVTAAIHDAAGDLVATATVAWRLAPL